MFESARLKLTAWYLLIIMGVSIVFSYAIYTQIDRELMQFEMARQIRQRNLRQEFQVFGIPQPLSEIDDSLDVIYGARDRLILRLALINLGIFVVAGGAGYFLAGRTLKPIRDMLDDQNRFVTDASHELRTPLTSLKTSLEVNLREKKLTTAQAKAILQSNLEEVNTMQALTDDLILLAQYQKPHTVSYTRLHLDDLIHAAISQVSALAKVKNIQIISSGDTQVIEGERKNLQTLFIIFLENAIKYSPEAATITIETKEKEKKAQIVISDTGIGIAKEDIPHIFERFYRAEKSRTRSETSGYGLGLSIAKKIVDMHNGNVSVKSEKDAGSIFTITLPLKQPPLIQDDWKTRAKKLIGI